MELCRFNSSKNVKLNKTTIHCLTVSQATFNDRGIGVTNRQVDDSDGIFATYKRD